MHIDRALFQSFPYFSNSEPRSGDVRCDEARKGKRRMTESSEQEGAQCKPTAQNRGNELHLPFVNVRIIIVYFQFTRNNLWEWHITPTPEFRRCRTGDTSDGGGLPVSLDGDLPQLIWGHWYVTSAAITYAIQQSAMCIVCSGLSELQAFC